MNVRALDRGDPARETAAQLVAAQRGASLAALGADDERSVLLGGFEGERLVAVGLFRDYHDPRLHVGTPLDAARSRDLLGLEGVGLYQIALLLGDEAHVSQAAAAERLLGAFEGELAARFERHALFITLLDRANRPARPLYRRLGFRPKGAASSCLTFDLRRLGPALRRIPPLPAALDARFFDDATAADRAGFARCYEAVFGAAGGAVDVGVALDDVLRAPDFAAELSLLLRTRADGAVVGFMLADRAGPGRMHIGVAALLPAWRGQRLPWRCLPPIAARALARGIGEATFVTTLGRVVRLTLRAFGARETDRLQLWCKVG